MRSSPDSAANHRDLTNLPATPWSRWLSLASVRGHTSALESAFLSIGALVVALVLFGLFVALGGRNPLAVYAALYVGAFGTRFSIESALTQAAPIILTALCTAVPARVGLLVIGGEGALV